MKIKVQSIKSALLALTLCFLVQGVAHAQVVEEVVCPGNDFCIEMDSSDSSTQWEESTDGTSFSDLTGENGISLCLTPVSDTAWYRARSVVAGCTIYSDTVRVVRSQLSIDAGSDTTFCDGVSYTLGGNPTASGSTGLTYTWFPATGLSSSSAANPTATPNVTTNYSLTVTDDDGCTLSDSVDLTVIPIPNDTIEFIFTGGSQFFVFPQCVDQATVEVWGAEGGEGSGTNPGASGLGGYAIGDVVYDSSLGDTLHLYVGGAGVDGPAGGTGGWNGGGDGGASSSNPGGGGGGASDVRYGADDLANRVLVAGGGGGGGGSSEGGLASLIAGDAGDGGAFNSSLISGGGEDGDDTNVSPATCVSQGGSGGFWNSTNNTPAFGQVNAGQLSCGCNPIGGLPSPSPEPTFNSEGGTGGAGSGAGTCASVGAGGGGGGGGFGGGSGAGGAMGDNVATNVWPAGGGGGGGSYFDASVVNNGNLALPPTGGNQGSGKIKISY